MNQIQATLNVTVVYIVYVSRRPDLFQMMYPGVLRNGGCIFGSEHVKPVQRVKCVFLFILSAGLQSEQRQPG